MTDEMMLTAAKLLEQAKGNLDGGAGVHEHAGLPLTSQESASLSFIEETVRDYGAEFGLGASLADLDLGRDVLTHYRSRAVTEAIERQNPALMSYLAGVTEKNLDGSAISLVADLLTHLDNADAPTFLVVGGNPNTGKTNTTFLAVDVWKKLNPDGLVLSNSPTWNQTDIFVPSIHDAAVASLENRTTPKALIVDESSSHFDANQHRYEVTEQWTPFAKAFAKVGIDLCGNIIHTGKDFHPEGKRLSTLACWKEEKETAEFFGEYPEDQTRPEDPLFSGPVENIEPHPPENYDPDDRSPWAWNLNAEAFTESHNWDEVLNRLLDLGPAE